MLSKKIFLSAAFVSMAGLVACGDDSSSNSGSDSKDIPEKVETIDKALRLNCNEEIKCTMVYVEEVKDNFFCNGTNFEPYSPILNAKDCPAEEENKGEEGTEEGDNKSEGSEEEGDNKAPESSASEAVSADSGATSTDSGEGSEGTKEGGNSSEGSENTGDNGSEEGGEGSEGGEEVTGPTGDLVSCTYTAEGVMGGTYCDEVAASMQSALAAQCEMMEGTMKTDGGCSQDGVQKKCPSESLNHYIYSGDDTCPTF